MRHPALLAILLGLTTALAVTYRVDPSGGPLTLAEDISSAFESWFEVSQDLLEAIEDDAATTEVRFGDPALFGPDTFSLTVQRSGEEASVEVLFNPTGYRGRPTSLLHETGILLGLGASGNGVMRAALSDDSPTEPTAEDIEALNTLRTFAPEDLTKDGVVDFYDLAAFAEQYGRQGVNLPADFDKDGVVGENDLSTLRSAYTFTPPSPTPPTSQPESALDFESPGEGSADAEPEAEAVPEGNDELPGGGLEPEDEQEDGPLQETDTDKESSGEASEEENETSE
ncbi:MAG: hypothetical protein JSV66_13935 [Trueperaceae bacterium]|nr:MAG: hypothetical protein JSV66_13935 [Trueperaceae bacterium]